MRQVDLRHKEPCQLHIPLITERSTTIGLYLIILCMGSADGRRRYNVTPPLNSLARTKNDLRYLHGQIISNNEYSITHLF